MRTDRFELVDVAERIASVENRLHKLRHRVGRLQQEGSDARREQELLEFLCGSLGDLYHRQTRMRRSNWIA